MNAELIFDLLRNSFFSFSIAAMGLLSSLFLSALLGFAAYIFKRLHYPVYFISVFTKVSPAIAYIPLFQFYGLNPYILKIVTSSLICLYPLMVELLECQARIPKRFIRFALLKNATRLNEFRVIGWGFHVDAIFKGLVTAGPLAFIGALVGDYIVGQTKPGGLGEWLASASRTYNEQNLILGIMATTALGLIFFFTPLLLSKLIHNKLNLHML